MLWFVRGGMEGNEEEIPFGEGGEVVVVEDYFLVCHSEWC